MVHRSLLERLESQNLAIPNAGKNVEQQGLVHVGESAKCLHCFGRQSGNFLQSWALSYQTSQQSLPLTFTKCSWKHVRKKTCTQMFMEASFIITRNWKQLRCLSVSGQTNWYTLTMDIIQQWKKWVIKSSTDMEETYMHIGKWKKPI